VYRVVLLPEAEADVTDAAAWYESQRERAGLGREFLQEFRAATEKLRRDPLLFQAVFAPIRRILLRRFPFAVFYEVVGREVVVLTCAHTSRDPEFVQQRIRRE
jgi:plasmid stabilization system protein ParE